MRQMPGAGAARCRSGILAPIDGYDLVLTIDEVIQHIVERALDKAMVDFAPEAAGVIAGIPRPAASLLWRGAPILPPKLRRLPRQLLAQSPISNSLSPAQPSLVTISAALEEGVVTFHDGFFCPGYFSAGGRNIKCWSAGHGPQSIKEVLWNSCNPGFMSMGTRLGKEKLFDYIRAFGYGGKTGIDLPGEHTGILFDVATMTSVDLAVASFGQGNAVTPIQQLMTAAAIANGGLLMKPRVVEEIRTEDGELVRKIEPEAIRQVITPETARELAEVLADGVERGSGVFAMVEGYRIAGKTGTAQKIAPGGGYLNNLYILSYVGFGPIDDPQIAIYVFVDGATRGPNWGGQVAGPVFKEIMTEVMRYRNIPPQDEHDPPQLPEEVEVPAWSTDNDRARPRDGRVLA